MLTKPIILAIIIFISVVVGIYVVIRKEKLKEEEKLEKRKARLKRDGKRFIDHKEKLVKPSLDLITFDDQMFEEPEVDEIGKRWKMKEWSGITSLRILHEFWIPKSPDEFKKWNDAKSEWRVLEFEHVFLDEIKSLKGILRIPQCELFEEEESNRGMAYMANIFIPFKRYCIVSATFCYEVGTTGIRETMLLDRGLSKGDIDLDIKEDEKFEVKGDWNPYNRNFDPEFPDHPLSVLRRFLDSFEKSFKVDKKMKNHLPYKY